jgi:hypothetical protein
LTIFYYFQPQKIILQQPNAWTVDLKMWNIWHRDQPLLEVPVLAVLLGVGIIGYLMALWKFTRRDLPAPL